jgi:outer membrane protein TolC
VAFLDQIECLPPHALALSGKWRKRRAVESVQTARNAKLETLMKSQAKKIAELERAYIDLQRKKENVTAGY